MNESVCIFYSYSIQNDQTVNMSTLVKVNQLSQPMFIVNWYMYALLSLNGLNNIFTMWGGHKGPVIWKVFPGHGVIIWYVFSWINSSCYGPLFTKQMGILQQDLVKSQTHEIQVYTFPITLKFHRHLSSTAAEMHIKLQSYMIIISSNLATLILHEIWW